MQNVCSHKHQNKFETLTVCILLSVWCILREIHSSLKRTNFFPVSDIVRDHSVTIRLLGQGVRYDNF